MRWTLERMRDAALLALPVFYTVGFLGWSAYAFEQGLGFLALSPPQYLVAGVMGTVLVAGGVAAYFTAHVGLEDRRAKWLRRRRLAWARLWRGVTDWIWESLAMPGVLLLVVLVGTWMNALDVSIEGVVGVSLAVNASLIGLVRVTQATDGSRRRGRNRNDEESGPAVVMVVSGAFLFFLFSLVLLPSMESEYGGAKPRNAFLDLEATSLAPATQSSLLPPGNATSGVTRSVNLTVFMMNERSVLVRPSSAADADDPLFEVSMAAVRSIQWLD